ncbi:hypothetical protein BJ878DRAFT_518893 [Calycina marina]|uniref:Cytochrome b mRNA-processing protein 4 n=1 Tax=Calycina marina TaxID=1763456 RepID=A0A9P7YXR2_9HELO|nr:hypothetical protein BJ878DRAFT_518893 [Calycina marina]
MPPRVKGTNWVLWGKMFAAGAVCCIGGPALIYWVSPTEEELFLRYNPELQKRSLENRAQKEEDFDNFVKRLKEYSKSDKHIWEAAADAESLQKKGKITEQAKLMVEMQKRKDEIRSDGIRPVPGGSL